MTDPGRRATQVGHEVSVTWRRLGFEQRIAGVASVLLIVSTFGPFSFVELAEIVTGVGVLALLRARALGKRFHLPFGDGTVIMAAGGWAALLIVVRLFDRPLGQNLLALVCAAVLALAGLRESAKRPADDVPEAAPEPGPEPEPAEEPTRRLPDSAPGMKPATPAAKQASAPTEQLTLPDTGLADGSDSVAGGEADEQEAGAGGEDLNAGGDHDRLA